MMRIDAAGRTGTVRAGYRDRPAAETVAPDRSRALTVLPGGRTSADEGGSFGRHPRASGRPEAGFVAHLIVAADPGLCPSRIERSRAAAAVYARACERLG